MKAKPFGPGPDLNRVVGDLLRDLAAAQTSQQKAFGYKRAAAAVLSLDVSIDTLVEPGGAVRKIAGLGPASMRVVHEVMESGVSSTVERAVDESGRSTEIRRRRLLREHVLSRAEVLRVLADESLAGPSRADYLGDLQMHSEWSDGVPTLADLAAACLARGYRYCAVTDHSRGLPIAGGMSMEKVALQHREIANVNDVCGDRFRMLRGIEANIAADGSLDVSAEDARQFEIVLAAPHSKLRIEQDQTDRLLRAIAEPHVHVLAHPRGRIAGSRAGVVADWDRVFAHAARHQVAVEIDGDPSRQDLDYALAAQALEAGCLFALDSDAHTTDQLSYADTAIAHARLAGIPADRIINCWPLEALLSWCATRRRPTAGLSI